MHNRVSDPLRALEDILKPDPRCEFLAQTLESLHAELSLLVLHQGVPSDVRQLYETAKNARLYTHFVYRFHQVAEMLAYQTLERGLKTRWNTSYGKYPSVDDHDFRSPGLAQLLKIAKREGWIRNEGFESRRYRAINSLTSERLTEALRCSSQRPDEEIVIPNPTESEIDERTAQIDILTILANTIPRMRNVLAHGSAKLAPNSDLLLRDVADVLNMLFEHARRESVSGS